MSTWIGLGVLWLVGAAPSGSAEIELDRHEVVRRAAAENPQVATARALVQAARARHDQARAARWPLLTVDAGIAPSLRADLVPGTGALSRQSRYDIGLGDISVTVGGSASVLQPLITFGKIGRREEAAAETVAAREAQVDITRSDVALRAAELYEAWLFADAAILFFEDMKHRLDVLADSTRARMQAEGSSVSEEDVLCLETSSRLMELGLHKAEAGHAQAVAGVRALLGIDEKTPVRAADAGGPPLPAVHVAAAALVKRAAGHRPELVALRHGVRALEKLGAAERAGYAPDIFLLGFVAGAWTPGRDLIESRYISDPLYFLDAGVLAGARWTLQWPMPAARAAQQEAEAAELRYQRDWVGRAIFTQVKVAYEDYLRAENDLVSARDGVERATRWLVRAEADYSMGLGPLREVTDAADAYVTLRTGELEACYRHDASLAALAHATGTLTTPGGDNPYLGEPR